MMSCAGPSKPSSTPAQPRSRRSTTSPATWACPSAGSTTSLQAQELGDAHVAHELALEDAEVGGGAAERAAFFDLLEDDAVTVRGEADVVTLGDPQQASEL